MKYLIIYAHPNPKSFNHAILEAISGELRKKGKEFEVRDLYGIGFNPVLKSEDLASIRKGTAMQDVQAEQDYIRAADFLIFIYPLWWAGMPAMLKGYIDRVFSEGFAYRISSEGIEGLLPGKKVFLVTTTGASKADYEDSGFFKSMDQLVDVAIFRSCNLELVGHKYFSSVPSVSDSDRRAMLEELTNITGRQLI